VVIFLLDLFLSELHLTAKKYPKMLVHLTLALMTAVILEDIGFNIPQTLTNLLPKGSSLQVAPFMSLILMFSFAILYLALVSQLSNVFRDSMRKTVEEFSTRDISSTIVRLKTRCFTSDILDQKGVKNKLKIAGFSLAFLLSYHLMVLHLVYFLDSLYSILSTSSFIATLSSEPAYPYSLAALFLGALSITYYIRVSEQGLSDAKNTREEPLSK
jgi:hypothetical protein